MAKNAEHTSLQIKPMDKITSIRNRIDSGDMRSSEQLLPLVYDELRKLAGVRLANERPGQTQQATALVHKVWLKLNDDEDSRSWSSRGDFFGAAAECIRRTVVGDSSTGAAEGVSGDSKCS